MFLKWEIRYYDSIWQTIYKIHKSDCCEHKLRSSISSRNLREFQLLNKINYQETVIGRAGSLDRWLVQRRIIDYQLIVARGQHMESYIFVNINSGDGLVPSGTKPLPESMLIIYDVLW